jgi:hypothetical protein
MLPALRTTKSDPGSCAVKISGTTRESAQPMNIACGDCAIASCR